MKTYRGQRTSGGCTVTVDGRPLPLRLDLQNHSPTGLEWGYGGSGPAQLALAILADCLGDDDLAVGLHQAFKWQVVAHLPHEGFELTEEAVRQFVQQQRDKWAEERRQGQRHQAAIYAALDGTPKGA